MGRVLSSNKAVIVKKRILITGGAGFIGSHLCDIGLWRRATKFSAWTIILLVANQTFLG